MQLLASSEMPQEAGLQIPLGGARIDVPAALDAAATFTREGDATSAWEPEDQAVYTRSGFGALWPFPRCAIR